MCFSMRYKVDHVENPDMVQSFDVFRVSDGTMTESEAHNTIDVAIRFWLDNQVVKAVLDEAAKFDKNEEFVYGDTFPEVPERSVVFAELLGQQYLVTEAVHPELLYATLNMRMANKIIVLQLKDFGFVVMYSVEYTVTADAYVHANVRIKLGTEAEQATVYNCVPWPLAGS